MELPAVSSGIEHLDDVLQGLRLGDNVVWQVDNLDDYLFFVGPFIEQAITDGRVCVYLRFAHHPPVLEPRDGLEIIEVDPSPGFDYFSREVHRIIEERGREVFYVLDNLSALAVEWATDELLANFFQVTCPYLFELDTVTYFALTRGRHAHNAVARIRDTTQILIDAYHARDRMYIHPIKVWDRYSPQMFLPHEVGSESWSPVFGSGDAAAVSSTARRNPLRGTSGSIAPWDSVYRKLGQYRAVGPVMVESNPELAALKQELCRMLIGNHPEFSKLADKYLTLEDLFGVRERLVGSGRIGGKAAGMLVARRILLSAPFDFSRVLEDHDSFYIGSDVFFTFLVNNDLFRMRLQLTKNSQFSRDEFEEVEKRFLEGKFPAAILEQFRNMLDYFGQAPIIVRSSSLLEDSFGNAFAGKYRSEFCANQGSPEDRLEAFLRAAKLVYASALNPDALSYRRKRGLGESDEQMAILVQRVSGMPCGSWFFPSIAGVAFSRNLYAWNDRIDPNQGMIRLVFGLGTRAVDRVGGDYPRMIAVSHPGLRPEIGLKIAKYSQRLVDLLDLKANELVTRPACDVLADHTYPNLHLLVSVMSDDDLQDPITNRIPPNARDLVLTFNNLIRRTGFVKTLGSILTTLEGAYGHPVDTEFTASVSHSGEVRINLLQCRPLWLPGSAGPVSTPTGIPSERVLFRSSRMISGGVVSGIRHIVYIDPKSYAAQPVDTKKALGRLVGRINSHPRIAEGKVLMMGPGRWGSSNIDLGVNVGYADIDNAAVLVELAREEAGHVPEVSYGTHFFQDLVEGQIIYLPVYPDDANAAFNEAFFAEAPNTLTDLLPDAAEFDHLVLVIDVPAVANGSLAEVVADPQVRDAVCYLG
ncbi:MAG: PEP/pyruvate-binding domain-containing protein [Armatimonadetes bacterium]|nr:PEP/pyruvate-binding domain-containing protein [Armatimonadota bacterium]